tara:strand:+ start:240 stop:398 length:159 start_codon:yes stop_codon:yes gene_type:complete
MKTEQEIDWKSVCDSFYHACGGVNGCGDLDWVDELCNHYQFYFEENEDEEQD